MNAQEQYLADFRRIKASLPGSDLPWLNRARELALRKFADLGFPTTRDEDWKYTNVAALSKHAFAPASTTKSAVTASHVWELSCRELPCHLMVFINGRYAPELSNSLPTGTISLARALEQQPQTIEPFFDSEIGDAFGALNLAFASDGAVLRLPKGAAIERPIYLLFISSDESHAIHPRNLIVAEEGAQATIVEHYCGVNGAAYFTNAVTQITAEKNSSLKHYKLQQEGINAFHIANIDCQQLRDSRFESHSLALGAALSRNEISTCFAGQGAETVFNGLYVAGGHQHMDHRTHIDHVEPQCTSREFYRGVLNDHARAVFHGKVIVREGAQKSDSSQANHNLLLSKDAEVDTRPQLEIYADDVKCTHGATVGQLDEDMIFYLRSRGVHEELAKAILTYAFAHDIIGRIELAPLKRKVADALIARLPERERIREFV
jgi:Fe-S cluster assembly protein SufD